MPVYVIDIGYLSDKYFNTDLERQIDEAAGTQRWGSGMGWGVRDIQYEYPTEREAEDALDRIRKVFDPPPIPFLGTTPYEYLGMYQEA